MYKLVAIAVFAALSACSKPAEETPAPAAVEPSVAAPAEVPGGLAVDGKPNAGVFEITFPDGKIAKQTYSADGSLSSTIDGKTVTGTWTMKEPGRYCVTLDGETNAMCTTDKMDGDVWISISDTEPSVTYTVKRVE